VLVLFLSNRRSSGNFAAAPIFARLQKCLMWKFIAFSLGIFYKRCQLIAQSASTVSHRKGDSKVSRERPTYRGPPFFLFFLFLHLPPTRWDCVCWGYAIH
jgi:hypothetical protein